MVSKHFRALSNSETSRLTAILECLDSDLRGVVYLHVRRRVAKLLELLFAQAIVRCEDRLAFDVLEFRNPFADVVAIGVTLLCLWNGIEDRVAGLPAVSIVRKVLQQASASMNNHKPCA